MLDTSVGQSGDKRTVDGPSRSQKAATSKAASCTTVSQGPALFIGHTCVNLGHEGYYLLYKGVISSLFATTTMARVSKRARKCRYPCERCQEECVRDVIECSECECWTHASCIPMDKTMLRNWSGADKDFLCESCEYTGGSYDTVKALQRYVAYFVYFILPQ